MVKKVYKLMFREKGQKRFYNFWPTMKSSFKFGNITSISEIRKLKKFEEKQQPNRVWIIKKR